MYDSLDALLEYDLTELLDNIMSFVDFIDSNYQEITNNAIMRYWQAKGVTLKSALLTDLVDWLCCLAFSDGFIAPQEVEFINLHLKQNYSENEIIDLCKFRIDEDYFKNVPLSFILVYEHDLIMKKIDIDFDLNSIEILHALFMVIGVQFIHCDNEVVLKELKMLNRYIENLSKRIQEFNLIGHHLAILEMSDGEIGDEYLENRYPFSKEDLNDYNEELSELGSLEDINEEIQNNDSILDINFTPWMIKPDGTQTNLYHSKEIKTDYSWSLDKNINDYYDFTGEFDNHLADIEDIITVENRQILENTLLTPQQYRSILNKIKLTSDNILFKIFNENYVDFNSLNLFEKILLFTNSFVDADYKSSGEELGIYSFNKIYLDDRLYSAYQIITLIHELSHHLLSEIFEQAVMILLNTDKTDALELYVDNALKSSNCFVLLNEYCAHSVENHFMPSGYQEYGSFLKVLEEFDSNNDKDKKIVLKAMLIGKTFSQDILTIINSFFDSYNLSEEIKQEFKNEFDDFQGFKEFPFEINHTLDINHLLDYVNFILVKGLDESLNNIEL